MRSIFFLYLVCLFGCSDYKLSSIKDAEPASTDPLLDSAEPEITYNPDTGAEIDVDYPIDTGSIVEDVSEPDIEVSESFIDFGKINAIGEFETKIIFVKNIGNADLNISNISVLDNTVYILSPILDSILSPGEESQFSITYDPITYETNIDHITILSNDPDEPNVQVDIIGDGSAPVIDINPSYYDFGTTLIGCDDETNIELSNIGDVDLIISDITFFISFPVDMALSINEIINGELPWTIPPSSKKEVILEYEPIDTIEDFGFLEVSSNDPATPIARAEQIAKGDFVDSKSDEFEQFGISSADILFVIDNSGSMGVWQTTLTDNFNSFISVFSITGVDYQIAVITTDDDVFQGPILTDATPDLETEFTDQAIAGTYGSAMEKGLHYAELATLPGGDASPGSDFLRDDAKLIIIFVSDEKDWSSKTDAEYESHFKSLKTSDSLVTAHAVVGDSPSGCSMSSSWTSADYGEGYIEVSALLGGEFVSICSEDWGSELESLAHASILDRSFELSDEPFEDSIEVYVDGAIVTDWTYNISENTVNFLGSYVPPSESIIEINYSIIADCSDGDTAETF